MEYFAWVVENASTSPGCGEPWPANGCSPTAVLTGCPGRVLGFPDGAATGGRSPEAARDRACTSWPRLEIRE